MAERIKDSQPQMLLSLWLQEQQAARGISPHTSVAYQNDVAQFLGFLIAYQGQQPTVSSLGTLSLRDIRGFLAECQRKEIGAASRNRKLSAIKSYLKFVYAKHAIKNDEVMMIRGPKKPQRLPRPLSIVDAGNAIEIAKDVDKRPWIRARDTALLTLLYACGLRISEALSLTGDQTPLGPELRILGKGRKVRMVPVLPAAREAMDAYIAVCPYDIEGDAPIFRAIRGGVMSSRDASKLMENVRNLLGLPPSATPHAMRHSFASHLLGAGGDIRAIQELLGHSSLSATQIYTKLDETQLIDVYRKSHPKGKG